MRIFFLCLLLAISFSYADSKLISSSQNFKPYVFSKMGNIFYASSKDRVIQITHSNKDNSPLLSPNRKLIAFIREDAGPILPPDCDDLSDNRVEHADQLRIFDLETKKDRLLVKNDLSCDNREKLIIDADHLVFSLDSKILYFLTSAWMTSDALHAINVDGTQQHFIAPAQEFEIIPKGQYKGYLAVLEHRHFVGGGSYDWYWLLNTQGKEEGPLGAEITADQREYLETNYS